MISNGRTVLILSIAIFVANSINSLYLDHESNWRAKHANSNIQVIGNGRNSSLDNYSLSLKTPQAVCKEENGQFADHEFCDKYWDCWEGKPVSSGQCSHGLMFNEQTASCDYPANVNCNGKEVSQPFEDKDEGCEEAYGTFPNRYYCDQYTVCHAGMAAYYRCDPGLAFDPKTGMCLQPQESPSCLDGTPPEDQPEIPLDPENIKPQPPSGPSGGGDNGITFPIIPGNIPHSTICPITGNGFIPIVNDCHSVLVCLNGRGFLFQCPKGEYYFPREAKCRIGIPGQCEQFKFMSNRMNKSNVRSTFNNSANTDSKNVRFGYFSNSYPLLP